MTASQRDLARREARLRRALRRRDLAVRKDRKWSRSLDHRGGYMLVNPFLNTIVAGERYDLSLEDLEAWARA